MIGMTLENLEKISIQDYLTSEEPLPVYRMRIQLQYTPLDINIQFIKEEGWNQTDRIRFHLEMEMEEKSDHPLAQLIDCVKPHMLIRRYNREEDSFIAVSIGLDREIIVLSNDRLYAQKYIPGLILNCPPSFHSMDEIEVIEEGWLEDETVIAYFMGLLMGAIGWDPSLQIPPAIHQSLEEAHKALSIANYRSCVVMCRRTIEALLKFSLPRLLGIEPRDASGRSFSLYRMIERFREIEPPIIPLHLLHLLDSVRLIGNVPGAHAEEIPDYPFSKSDAEFALASVHYFLDQYFSKIDPEVTQYYTLTIDLSEGEE